MEKTITSEDRSIFYQVIGKGEPVVLLHGFTEDGQIWNKQVPFLEKDYQLIIPDLPGSGFSELALDVSMEAMATLIKAILDEENISETIIVGHSMGGYVTLAFAEKYPEVLRGFGLFHSTAYPDPDEKKESRQKNIRFIESHGTYEFLKQAIPGLFTDDFKSKHPEIVNGLIQQYRVFTPEALSAYLTAMMQRPDRTEVLKKFVKPILFIIGKHDNAIPFQDSLQLCHLPSLSYIHILDDSAHMGMLEETEKSNNILREFLQDVHSRAQIFAS